MCFSCGNGNANDECDFVHDLGCVMVRCITDNLLRTSLSISLVFVFSSDIGIAHIDTPVPLKFQFYV